MAKKKRARAKAQTGSVLSRLQSGVKKMQRDAQTAVARARTEALRLARTQQRGLNRVVRDAQRLRGDFERMAKRTSKDLDVRSKRLLASVQKEVERRLEPLVGRLVGPSRKEVQHLSQRVRELEQYVRQHSHTAAAAAEPPAAATTDPPAVVD